MPRVLIVDDLAENMYYLEALLKGNGYQVDTARNGEQALESARNSPPDLVVSDILMPVMDGYTLCREWRADKRLALIPFLFYTATYTDLKDEALAYSLGADRFVIKPQEPGPLMEIITEMLAASREGGESTPVGVTGNEAELLKAYNETLFRKLEKKMADLERVNQELLQNIAERKHAEVELLQAKEAAEAATRVKSQFLANMSHELRTPMTGVLGMLDLAIEGPLEAQQREFIETAQTSARSQVRILNDILDMTKIEAGKLSIENKPFPIRSCIENISNTFTSVAKGKGLDFYFTVADDVPRNLLGDQTRLSQVLTNLAGNAVKFTEKGEVAIGVAAGGIAPDGKREVTFTVTDTGIGIPEDKRDQLFRIFSQVDESHSREYGGTGLGLAISKEIVELMGGTIRFTSTEGKGSSFTFTIPFAEAEVERDDIPESVETVTELAVPKAERTITPRLLVAEDDQTNRLFLSKVLQRSNYEVCFAEDGQIAVDMWEGGEFDLILMDIQMPIMNGFEATAAIRKKESSRGGYTPIIAVTAHASEDYEKKCITSGMDAYISKPIDFKKALQLITKELQKHLHG
jgi:signal transduction histidine kinase